MPDLWDYLIKVIHFQLHRKCINITLCWYSLLIITYRMSMAASMARSWLKVCFLMWGERRVMMEARLHSRPDTQKVKIEHSKLRRKITLQFLHINVSFLFFLELFKTEYLSYFLKTFTFVKSNIPIGATQYLPSRNNSPGEGICTIVAILYFNPLYLQT